MVKKTLVLLLIIINILNLSACKESVLKTENIDEYNSDDYPISVFLLLPQEIPSNSRVMDFSYYKYYSEDFDYYLELKFNSKEELESHLKKTLSDYEAILSSFDAPQGGWFYEETNPYNEKYTDLLSKSHASYIDTYRRVGYEVENGKLSRYYSCNYGILSYSFDELTVIHTDAHGTFYDQNKHIPKYLLRFNCSTRIHKRMVVF